MATYTWLGGKSTKADPNDATSQANWISSTGTFGIPAAGDTIVVPPMAAAAFTVDLPAGVTLLNNIISVGSGDTINLNGDLMSGGRLSLGAAVVLTSYDTTIAAPIHLTGSATINVSGDMTQSGTLFNSGPTPEVIAGSVFTSLSGNSVGDIVAGGSNESLAFNATGNVFLDNGILAASPGGSVSIHVAPYISGSITVPGFLDAKGALILVDETGSVSTAANATFANNGFSYLQGGSLSLSATMAGEAGVWSMHHSTLDVATKMPGAQSIVMGDATGGSLLKIEAAATVSGGGTVLAGFASHIAGFQAGDTIELVGITGLTGNLQDGVLTLLQGLSVVGRLRFAANQAPDSTSPPSFVLTASGGNTFITSTQTSDFANNVAGATTVDWGSSALWSGGTIPGGNQVADVVFAPNQLTLALGGTFASEAITVTTAETAGSLVFDNPLATLEILAPLTLQSAVAGATGGGAVTESNGTIAVLAGGTLTAASVSQLSHGGLEVASGGTLSLSGTPSFTSVNGFTALTIAGDATIDGSVLASGGVLVGPNAGLIGTLGNSQSNMTLENGASLTASFTQISGQSFGSGMVWISGNGTTWKDAGDPAHPSDASPYLGDMIVGGGGFNFSGTLSVSGQAPNGYGQLQVDQGATLSESGSAILGMTGLGTAGDSLNSHGIVTVQNAATWNIAGQLEIGGSHLLAATGVAGGDATANIQNAGQVLLGTVETAGLYKVALGASHGSSGTLNVFATGVGGLPSSVDAGGGPIAIGEAGQGFINVISGGALTGVAHNAAAGFGWAAILGDSAGSSGTLNVVDGTFSAAGDVVVGNAGFGSLNVSGHSTFHVGGSLLIGGTSLVSGGGSGEANLQGSSPLSIGGNILVDSGSTLNIGSGGVLIGTGTATADTLTIPAGHTLAVAGTLLMAAQTLNNAGLVVAAGADQTLDLNFTAGAGTYEIAAGATLAIHNAVPGDSFKFDSGNGAAGETVKTFIFNPGYGAHVHGFYGSDRIDLPNVPFPRASPSVAYVPNASPATGGTATLTAFGTSIAYAIDDFHPAGFSVGSDGIGGTLLIPNDAAPCFAAGTRIATARGPVAVEALAIGDVVVLADGGRAPVVWLGHRTVACSRHPRPWDVHPVTVAAHAFAPGQPAHALTLSPDHAVFVDGVLIPVRYLLNGRTIAQRPARSVQYWHVELDRHAVLLAEGMPCESYLDTGNRAAFANGGGAMQLHPDFALHVWQAQGCAPLVRDGAALAAARRGVLAQAVALGHAITADPGLHLFAGDAAVAAARDGGRWSVLLPAGTSRLRLHSRCWVPAQMRADEHDTRTLGVALAQLWLDGRAAALDSPGLSAGWNAPEPHGRWTDGDGVLAVRGVRRVDFTLGPAGTYWQDTAPRRSGTRRKGAG